MINDVLYFSGCNATFVPPNLFYIIFLLFYFSSFTWYLVYKYFSKSLVDWYFFFLNQFLIAQPFCFMFFFYYGSIDFDSCLSHLHWQFRFSSSMLLGILLLKSRMLLPLFYRIFLMTARLSMLRWAVEILILCMSLPTFTPHSWVLTKRLLFSLDILLFSHWIKVESSWELPNWLRARRIVVPAVLKIVFFFEKYYLYISHSYLSVKPCVWAGYPLRCKFVTAGLINWSLCSSALRGFFFQKKKNHLNLSFATLNILLH